MNQVKLECFIHAFFNIYTKGAYHNVLSFKTRKSAGTLECKFPSNQLLDQFLQF
ncbi:AsnC family transcriptional regulator [Bacillus paralicheniformis]|nr:AsnC family transcriptional regulator [Bacillus paralicheniformis]TWL50353.1 hypothetical protein CHCC15332_4302 [Bacillus paralicheniformis]